MLHCPVLILFHVNQNENQETHSTQVSHGPEMESVPDLVTLARAPTSAPGGLPRSGSSACLSMEIEPPGLPRSAGVSGYKERCHMSWGEESHDSYFPTLMTACLPRLGASQTRPDWGSASPLSSLRETEVVTKSVTSSLLPGRKVSSCGIISSELSPSGCEFREGRG